MTSYYVKRRKGDRTNWVGPLALTHAHHEQNAWIIAGWDAWIHAATPAIKVEVAIWEQEKKARKRRAREEGR
jgi:hypothetical protein